MYLMGESLQISIPPDFNGQSGGGMSNFFFFGSVAFAVAASDGSLSDDELIFADRTSKLSTLG